MTVELTDEQYGIVARALVVIAAAKRYKPGGSVSRVTKDEMIQRAREAAASIDLRYLGDGSAGSAFPQEIGLEHRKRDSHGQSGR